MDILDTIVEHIPFVNPEPAKQATFWSVLIALPIFTIISWGLMALGAIPVVISTYAFLKFLWRNLFRKRLDLKKRYGEGSWACITGATSGIGEYFAIELAKEGFNILLHGRDSLKLKASKVIIQDLAPTIKVETIIGDFEENTSIEFFRDLANQINKFDVSILVNNAGFGLSGDLIKISDKELKTIVDTNCLPYVMLARLVGEKMYTRPKRSALINVGSVQSVFPMTGNITYSATKAFDDFLSRGIRYEMKEKIDVMCLRPAAVSTKATNVEPSFLTLKPEECVKGALRDLGREAYTYANCRHELQTTMLYLMSATLPEKLFMTMLHREQMKFMKTQREGWVKNDTAEAKKDLSIHEPKKAQ